MRINRLILLFLGMSMLSCEHEKPIFQLLPSGRTNITFENTITTDDSLNALYFEYIYNGGGVAVSDLNDDGLPDLFFTGNQVSSKLYLNRGNLQFEDITEQAGVTTDRWCTGVAVADVNNDGKQDIYVSVAGYQVDTAAMENLLYINQGCGKDGVPIFVEAAADYGLNDSGYSTQGAFFDYDKDGDLDLYLLTNAMETFDRNKIKPKRINGEAASTDRLYRNNGDATFTDVSRAAGILIEGYGLGVTVSDLNLDGFPDVYVANDFLSNDLVWMNNGDGTFTDRAPQMLQHQSHNGMGVDIADFNNDALPDIAVLDMLPEDNYRQKMMTSYVDKDKFLLKKSMGYQDQYMRNTLQLHGGFSQNDLPQYHEIGNLSGLSATDWSWAVLFADLDNDSWKDVYITNGYRKDITNLDYVNYSNYNQMFGTVESKERKAIADLDDVPDVEVSNYLFHNKGNLQFENATATWGLDHPSFSNGAVYSDLDLDGDLDLVINNMDMPAFVFENLQRQSKQANNYLQIVLEETQADLSIYNTKVFLYANGQQQYQEYSPFRGYKSTMDQVLHFGLGDMEVVDSIVVHWADETVSYLSEVAANQRLTITYKENNSFRAPSKKKSLASLFLPANDALNIHFELQKLNYSELQTTRTLPYDYAQMGPAIATGDINGDGLADFFVGGNAGQAGQIFLQTMDGKFDAIRFSFDSLQQDRDALLFDADGDEDLDLYVVKGETIIAANGQDCLYLNDGKGQFTPAPNALPKMNSSGSCVRAADYDGDGDQDLFVGGHVLPQQYPLASRSYLLENQNGKFVEVTPESLQAIGIVTDALWSDYNQDGAIDLIVVGEWMPITFFENRGGQLQAKNLKIDQQANQTYGWWRHISTTDFDADGFPDYVLGNIGLNSKLKASLDEPLQIYLKDFDGNQALDPLLSIFNQGQEHLLHERDRLLSQIPGMKRRFPDYGTYAKADLAHTLSQTDLEDAKVLKAHQLSSIVLKNENGRSFSSQPLPQQSQLSPINGSYIADSDQNGTLDLLTAGNFFATETNQIGHFDASCGKLLFQKTPFEFEASSLSRGLNASGDVRVLKHLKLLDGSTLLLLGTYGGELKAQILLSDSFTL